MMLHLNQSTPINRSTCIHERFNYEILRDVSDIIGFYIITITCSLGLIMNALCIKILAHSSLKHRFYKYLMCKSICDILVCFIGIGYLNNARTQCESNTSYGAIFFQWFIIKINLRIALLASGITEIQIDLDLPSNCLTRKL